MQIIFIILLFITIFEITSYTSLPYKKYKKSIFIAIVILLICIAGWREIGRDNDSGMYQVFFNEIGEMSYTDILFHYSGRIKEIGYILLNKIFSNLGFRAFLIFCAVISLSIKSYILYRFTKFPFISIFVYFVLFYYLRELSQIRDAIATSFILLCLMMYIKKKYFYSFLFFLLGISFHTLTIMCIGIIVFWELYKAKKWLCYLFLSLIVILKIYMPNLEYLSEFPLPAQLTVYITEDAFKNFKTGYFLPLFSLLLLVIFYIIKIKLKKDFLYFISLLTFISYLYALNNMVLIRIPNILFFGNIIAIGSTKYMTSSFHWIILIILLIYWIRISFIYII
ncbi:EpsG family protein [Chryseobacterium oranimense]|uniref:EpsG family protein n=1 Tax=Chryseobacterium oranimense TaxID=421058 RepID=UPI003CD09EA1